jgi:hypothetical protein
MTLPREVVPGRDYMTERRVRESGTDDAASTRSAATLRPATTRGCATSPSCQRLATTTERGAAAAYPNSATFGANVCDWLLQGHGL